MNIFNKRLTAKQRFFWFILAFAVRLFFVFKPGHSFDLNTFSAWGLNLLNLSGPGFLHQIWSDYLPLPLLFTKAIAFLTLKTHLSFILVWKLALSILELSLLWLIGSFKPFQNSLVLFLSLLFAPPLIINGSLWGQLDALVALSVLASFLFAHQKRLIFSTLAFVLAFSIKPLSLLIFPFLFFLWWSLDSFWHAFLNSVLAIFLVVFPGSYFISSFNPLELVKFFFHRLIFQASTYPFTSLNAFNFWSLFGHFWASDTFAVLGITAHTFGLTLFLFAYLFLSLKFVSSPKSNFTKPVKASILGLLAFYTLATRMHERHLLYSLPLFLLIGQPLYLWSFFGLSFVFSLNNWASLFWLKHTQTWPFSPFLNHLFSLSMVLIFLLLYLDFIYPAWFSKLKLFFANYKYLFLLFILAFSLRLFRLSNSPQMIFDEVYHAFTAREFVRGDNLVPWEWWHQAPHGYAYEWTHPPLAKYGMVVGMLMFGQNSFGWRFGSALLGAGTVVLLYLLTLEWFSSSPIALLAALMLNFDGLHLVQSRIAMNDIYLLFFSLLSLFLAQRDFWAYAALSFGLALASKWSALYLLLPLAYLFFKQYRFSLLSFLKASKCLFIAILTYLLSYAPFFLNHSWPQFIELQKQMWYYHTHLQATHPYQSKPWQWVFGLRPVWYYTKQSLHTVANIYAQSNPLILSLGTVLLVLLLPFYWQSSLMLPLLAYFSFVLPWIFSPRIMFFYHYLPSLAFFYPLLAYLLSKLPKFIRYSLILFWFFTTLVFLVPSIYALPCSQSYWHFLFKLFPSWQ